MLRRFFSVTVLSLALVVASMAWAGFIISNTVLDAGRSERLAEQLYADDSVRNLLVDQVVGQIEPLVPVEAGISDDEITELTRESLADPRVEALFTDALVRTHRKVLGLEDQDQPVEIRATAFSEAFRDAFVRRHPELGASVPAVAESTVTVPDTWLPNLGGPRRWLERATVLAGLVALAGIGTAFVVGGNRSKTLRRVGVWALGAGLSWVAIGIGLPWLFARLLPDSAAIFAAIIDIAIGAMVRPALTLCVVGGICYFVGYVLLARRGASAISSAAGAIGIPGLVGASEPAPAASPVAAAERVSPPVNRPGRTNAPLAPRPPKKPRARPQPGAPGARTPGFEPKATQAAPPARPHAPPARQPTAEHSARPPAAPRPNPASADSYGTPGDMYRRAGPRQAQTPQRDFQVPDEWIAAALTTDEHPQTDS